MQYPTRFAHVSDDEVLRSLVALIADSRRVEADLVEHIGEVDQRRLYAREAFPSMFAYCTERLHLSECEAYLRIGAARTAREHPEILEMLRDGRLHLSGIDKLAPHLTPANAASLLGRAAHLSKRRIEDLVAELAPRPDVPASIRKLPSSIAPTVQSPSLLLPSPEIQLRPDGVASPVTSAPVTEALAPERYKVQFTASTELRDKLERLQKLMSTDVVGVIERAVTEKLERLEANRFGLTKTPRKRSLPRNPRPTTRDPPAALKRAVYVRDEGRCRYVDANGRRCNERDRLEYHHHGIPYALGGKHTLQNVCLMCHAHNQYEADRLFGREAMSRHRSGRADSKKGSEAIGSEPVASDRRDVPTADHMADARPHEVTTAEP
jgi:hypothetical protein